MILSEPGYSFKKNESPRMVAVLSFGFQTKGGSRSTSQVEKHKSGYISADKGSDGNELPRRNSIPSILSVV